MEFDNITQLAFFSAGIVSCLLTGIFFRQTLSHKLHWSLVVAAAAQSAWLISVGTGDLFGLENEIQLLLEATHFTAWIFAAIKTTQHHCENCLPRYYKLANLSACGVLLTANALLSWVFANGAYNLQVYIWQGIVFAILGLFNVEQLYRNVINIRLIKLICLNLAAVFIYDVYFFAQSLVQPEMHSGFYQVRAVVILVTSLFMGLAAIALNPAADQPARLSLSRPVVFYTTSLVLACALLAIAGLGGYYVQQLGGHWGGLAYSALLVAAVLTVAFVSVSKRLREKLTVMINKHLFSHKYDYRSEWLKLIERLSQPTTPEDVHGQALEAVCSVFKSPGGALWLRRGQILAPVYQKNLSLKILDAIEPDSSAFSQAMERSEWVFLPASTNVADPLSQHNEHLPEWTRQMENLWLILPLLNETKLTGFMALSAPNGDASLNWEDLDLLKTVGRQVANYLERHEQAEQLAEARQFDAFNKLAAYVMHDLKNLIAQQSLVVKNAEKHKDNPAFVEDAIQTINNSVTRMNNLLHKLQRKEAEAVRVLRLQDVMVEAIKRCQKSLPVPTLRIDDENLRVKGDWDSLVMVFVHLIHNAQDATASSGFIDVSVANENHVATIQIEDNGEGMDAEFIRDRLFKPFDTTKSGKGMGIGVYQARDYVQALGGSLTVDSTPGEGTTFNISLPLVAG